MPIFLKSAQSKAEAIDVLKLSLTTFVMANITPTQHATIIQHIAQLSAHTGPLNVTAGFKTEPAIGSTTLTLQFDQVQDAPLARPH